MRLVWCVLTLALVVSALESMEKRVQLVEELDLSRVEESLTFKQGWTKKFAAAAVEEYKRFLILHVRFPEQRLVPSLAVDEVWHAHILFTRAYADDCALVFGDFLHHEPTLPSDGDQLNQADKDDYAEVVDLYQLVFGEKPGRGWRGGAKASEGATCAGACGGGACGGKTNDTAASNTTATCGSSCGSSCGSKKKQSDKSASCGSACGAKRPAKREGEAAGATCGSSCGSSCGSGKQQKPKQKQGSDAATCGSACGAGKQGKQAPKAGAAATCGSACGLGQNKKAGAAATCSSCGSSCGAGKLRRRGAGAAATCGSACGASKSTTDASLALPKKFFNAFESFITDKLKDSETDLRSASANAEQLFQSFRKRLSDWSDKSTLLKTVEENFLRRQHQPKRDDTESVRVDASSEASYVESAPATPIKFNSDSADNDKSQP